MWPMNDHMNGAMALYGILWLVVVGVGLAAAWRAMRAHEAIASHLADIARALNRPGDSPR